MEMVSMIKMAMVIVRWWAVSKHEDKFKFIYINREKRAHLITCITEGFVC